MDFLTLIFYYEFRDTVIVINDNRIFFMIPKVIHYVWVGPAEKPLEVKNCIASWRKSCPDYKIVEWNDEVLSSINNQYLHEAYKAGKWAFVSDVLRLYALLSGGIYCDTDVEIKKNLDEFLKNSFFMSFESNPSIRNQIKVPSTALIGAEPENKIIRGMLKEYENLSFKKDDGSFDLTTNVVRFNNFFRKNFPQYANGLDINRPKIIEQGIVIYPYYYFCLPKDGYPNYAIHNFEGTWLPPVSQKVILDLHSEVFNFLNFKILGFRKNKSFTNEVAWPPKIEGKLIFKMPWLKKSLIGIYKNLS